MNILFWSSVDFWVPSYVFNDNSYISWWNTPYFLLVLVAIFTCAWMTVYMTIVICEIRKFHGNATYLLASLYISWFEVLIGTLLMLPYKYGLVSLTDPPRVFEGFENTDDFLKLDKVTLKSVPLLIGSFLAWHYIGEVNSAFTCFFLERTWATVLFKDYESEPRKQLSMFLIILHQFGALLIAIIMTFHLIQLKYLLIMNVLGIIAYGPYLTFLRLYNVHARDAMRKGTNITNSSLAAKFQTEENVRSILLVSRITTAMVIFEGFFLSITILASLQVPGTRYYFQAVEHVMFFSPLFLVPAILSCVDDWRKQFFLYIPVNKIRIGPKDTVYTVPEPVRSHQQIAELHFEQLQNLWV